LNFRQGIFVMGGIRRNLIVVATVALLAAGCANESLGPEYGEISEAESGLQFYAPGLRGGYRKFIYGQDEQFVKRMIGVYGPKQGEYPHGQLSFIEMPPGRHFTRINPPQDTIEDWGPFENRAITRGPVGTAVNAIGRIDYAAFLADNLSCIIFRQPFGTVYDTGRGTQLLDGYYCKGEAPMMTKGEAAAIAKAVGHRKYGPLEPPAGWSGSSGAASAQSLFDLVVVWAGDDGMTRLTGTAFIGENGQLAEMRIVVGARGSCRGSLSPDSVADNVSEGAWELRCGDGSRASGRYKTISELASGEGQDENANKVFLTIKP
jgi:hypothetical protein